MRKLKLLLCFLLCAGFLCGCQGLSGAKTEKDEMPTAQETEPLTEAATQSQGFQAYEITVRSSNLPVFRGPGFHHQVRGFITDQGTYTITAEVFERLDQGKVTLWGKLDDESWINLEDALKEETPDTLEETSADTTEAVTVPFEPYIMKIDNPWLEIYAGPGYHYQGCGEILDSGKYTIVEEAVQNFTGGRSVIWGRLKSGVGWICLDDAKLKTDGGPPYRCTKCGRADVYISRYALCDDCYEEDNPAKYGYCVICNVAIDDSNFMIESFGKCYDCYYATLDPAWICDKCGADCSFMGITDGLCESCAAEE